jgi:hypothetical protein
MEFHIMAIKKSSGSGIPSGLNAGRPANPGFGQLYANGETSRLELFTQASGWQNIVQETPGVASISGTYNESAGSASIVISGTNFVNGAIASAIGTNGVDVQATTTTYNSLVQLTAVFTGLNAAHEPFDIKVTNPSNLFGLIPDALYINQSPVWQYSSGSLGSFNEGTSVSIAALATDPESNTLTFAITTGSLPSGLSLNTSTGAISGTAPSLTENITYSFTVSVTDSTNTTISRSFNITINSILTWSTASGSLGVLGYGSSQSYSNQLVAVGLGNTLNYSILSGSLPSGLSLSSSGLISGSAAEVVTTTTSNFTVRVSDGTITADRSFSLTINPPTMATYSTSGSYSISIPAGTTAVELTLLGAGGGGSAGNGEWAYGGAGGSYLKAIYPVSAGSYSLVVGSFGPGQTACNNTQHATNGKGGNTTFGTLVASGGSGGTQRSEGSYPEGNGIALANVTTGATSVIKNLIGQNGVGTNSGTGGSNGLKNIENISTYGQGPAATENFTAGNHATGNGNGGGGGASCQGGHRGGGNGSSGYAIIKY